jgi:hypothetical protein
MRAQLGPIVLEVADGWADTTPDADDAPYELTNQSPNAVGAFQFSTAKYRSGSIPDAKPSDLAALLDEFAAARGLGEPKDKVQEVRPVRLAAGTLIDGQYLMRVWYVSDGASFAKVTYTAKAAYDYAAELVDCERMVRTMAFNYGNPAA